MAHRLSRRDVIGRAAAVGASAPLSALLLKTGRVSAQDASPATERPAGWSIVVPGNLRTDLQGTEISIVLGSDGPGTAWEEAAVAAFSEATGIVVNRIAGAQQATDRLTQYQQLLGAQATDIDAMMIDVIWPGILASHAVDLTEALASQGYPYFDTIVRNNTVDGLLVGIPWFTDAGQLYYRTDLLDKHGYDGPPTTWTELSEMAQTIQDAERETNPDFSGFVWQGSAYEGLTCDALEWQVSYGGGVIVEDDLTVSIDNPQAIAAFEMARGWVGTISPEGVTTYNEELARGVWQQGNAAFMRNWSYAYALGQADDSVIKGTFDQTVLPMGEGEGATHAGTIGGWQMMVSKYSQNQEAAIEFSKYLTSKELQKAHAVERSNPPTIPDVFDDPDVVAANPFYPTLKEVLNNGVTRPSTVTADLYNEVSIAYFTAVYEIISGQAEAAAAVADLASELEGIVADL